jgi:hypothetical protein
VLKFFVILYLSFVSLSLWLIMVSIGNLFGLFIIFVGGDGYWGCCGGVWCIGLSTILGCSSLFSEMYRALSVLVWMWLGQRVGQFWLQVGLQNSCVAIFSALISSLVGAL